MQNFILCKLITCIRLGIVFHHDFWKDFDAYCKMMGGGGIFWVINACSAYQSLKKSPVQKRYTHQTAYKCI